MFSRILSTLVLLIASQSLVDRVYAQTTRPASVDPALWERMLRVDQLAGTLKDLTTHFEQHKFTPMLKKPLVSEGTVRIRGSTMRWDTTKPEPSVIFADDHEFRLYYPNQKLMEVYPIDRRLASLAASPLPRLNVLVQHFDFSEIDVKSIDPNADPQQSLAVRMTPISDILKDHVEQVRVLLDTRRGLISTFELTDTDGDKTVIRFTQFAENTGLKESDVNLELPANVIVSRPLEGLGDAPPSKR